jgi:hypothetical protein
MPTNPEITLRITTAIEHSVRTFMLQLLETGQPALNASGTFEPLPSDDLLVDLRWYMEQFLEERDKAAIARSKRVRESIKHFGKRLFQDVFQVTPDSRAIWRRVAKRLNQTRIEIYGDSENSGVLWELLRDPSIRARRSVRGHPHRPLRKQQAYGWKDPKRRPSEVLGRVLYSGRICSGFRRRRGAPDRNQRGPERISLTRTLIGDRQAGCRR